MDTALEALHVAAAAIRRMPAIKECTVDNDHKSGEIIFTTVTGEQFILGLDEYEEGS